MPFKAPVSDYQFILDHVVPIAPVAETDRFAEASEDMVSAILTEAGRMTEEVMAPLNRTGDLNPAKLENGVVRTAPGFSDAYAQIAEGG